MICITQQTQGKTRDMAMGVFDTIGNALSDGADAVIGGAEAVVEAVDEAFTEGEEAVGELTEPVGDWFMEEIWNAVEDFLNDGGTETDNNDVEDRATINSGLEAARVIPYNPAVEYGYDSPELTRVPQRFTSRLGETDASDRELDGFHLATDGAIGAVADIQTGIDAGPRRSPDRSEDRDTPTGGAGSASNEDSGGETLSEQRNDDATSSSTGHTVQSDTLQFIAPAGNVGETLVEASSERTTGTQHTPEWTNFNDSDPSITLADGGWMEDISLSRDSYSRHSDRGSLNTVTAPLVDVETTDHFSYATTVQDASPTLSWLH
jgi:hypothetical protein